jgi:hypothetical protein
MTPFFSIGKSSGCYVVSKTLYEAKKADNSLYSLERLLSPGGSAKLCTVFSCPEPFITSVLPDKKEEGRAEKLISELTVSRDQALELSLAKGLGCPIALSNKEVWLINAAKKKGIRVKVVK